MEQSTRGLKQMARKLARQALPRPVLELAKRAVRKDAYVPPVGGMRFGDFRRLEPVSRAYGYDRGRPIDRYYIEGFLEREAACIHGRVLEVGESTYTRRFGRGVTQSDVLHVSADCEEATFVDDLAVGASLPSAAFDCVILTQTLHLIFDMRAALETIARILKPSGTLLATVPGITQVSDPNWNDTWYWSLTQTSARRLCTQVFPEAGVSVETHGNVLAAVSFLQGLSDSELTREELDARDLEYPVTVAIKATREATESRARGAG